MSQWESVGVSVSQRESVGVSVIQQESVGVSRSQRELVGVSAFISSLPTRRERSTRAEGINRTKWSTGGCRHLHDDKKAQWSVSHTCQRVSRYVYYVISIAVEKLEYTSR